MEQKIIYAFRGWVAFLAFMDLGTAVRSYIEKRSFLSKTIEDINRFVDGTRFFIVFFVILITFPFRGIYHIKDIGNVFNT